MADPNIFAILTPKDQYGHARTAFRLRHNEHGFVAAEAPFLAEECLITSRETTPGGIDTDADDSILLRFDDPPKDLIDGWQFGTNPDRCDFILGHRGTRGISSRQFRITINHHHQAVLYDEWSRFGTQVSYDSQRTNPIFVRDKRVLCLEPDSQASLPDAVICVQRLSFTISFPNRKNPSRQYKRNLSAFINASRLALPRFGQIGFDDNPSTQPPSLESQSPRQETPYVYRTKLGSGSFGTVYQAVDIREGKIYAAKVFSTKRGENVRGEFEVMSRIEHYNIVAVREFLEEPPAIIMEYCPFGSLEKLENVDQYEHISIFHQLLTGIGYLHDQRIAHRDLKPANVLVAVRHPIAIRISDFGLAKALSKEKPFDTVCGTWQYAAPEVVTGQSRYLLPVDIWSIGVIILELIFGLPSNRMARSPTQACLQSWHNALITRIDDFDENNDQIIQIIKYMVIRAPGKRMKAAECLEKGCLVGLWRRSNGEIIDISPSNAPTEVFTDTEMVLGNESNATTPTNSNAVGPLGNTSLPVGQFRIIEYSIGQSKFCEYRDRHRVLRMRVTDYWTCILSIATAGGQTKFWADKRLAVLSRKNKESYFHDGHGKGMLVPYHLAEQYGIEIGLSEEIQRLADHCGRINQVFYDRDTTGLSTQPPPQPPQPLQQHTLATPEMSLPPLFPNDSLHTERQDGVQLRDDRDKNGEYRVLQWGDTQVTYMPVFRTINVRNLCQLGQVSKHRQRRYLCSKPEISTTRIMGSGVQTGFYISLPDALALCWDFRIDKGPIEAIKKLEGWS